MKVRLSFAVWSDHEVFYSYRLSWRSTGETGDYHQSIHATRGYT